MRSTYAGVDWASEKHDVLIADETGEEIVAATFAHDEAGVRGLCRTLVRHEVTLVAIERPDGLLVERAAASSGRRSDSIGASASNGNGALARPLLVARCGAPHRDGKCALIITAPLDLAAGGRRRSRNPTSILWGVLLARFD
jgi:hypothetical protein